MPQPTLSIIHRAPSDRRKSDGRPPPGIGERRIQAERRGIEVVEYPIDEHIALGNPQRSKH